MRLDGVQFVDASHGWFSSYGAGVTTLWRTSDGGLT